MSYAIFFEIFVRLIQSNKLNEFRANRRCWWYEEGKEEKGKQQLNSKRLYYWIIIILFMDVTDFMLCVKEM